MAQAPARVIDDGRITIPAHVRDNLGIEKGDYVLIDVQPLSRAGVEGRNENQIQQARVNRDSDGEELSITITLSADELSELGVNVENADKIDYTIKDGRLAIGRVFV